MSDQEFRNEVTIIAPELQRLIDDMSVALGKFDEINMRLKRIADLNGLNMGVPPDEEVD